MSLKPLLEKHPGGQAPLRSLGGQAGQQVSQTSNKAVRSTPTKSPHLPQGSTSSGFVQKRIAALEGPQQNTGLLKEAPTVVVERRESIHVATPQTDPQPNVGLLHLAQTPGSQAAPGSQVPESHVTEQGQTQAPTSSGAQPTPTVLTPSIISEAATPAPSTPIPSSSSNESAAPQIAQPRDTPAKLEKPLRQPPKKLPPINPQDKKFKEHKDSVRTMLRPNLITPGTRDIPSTIDPKIARQLLQQTQAMWKKMNPAITDIPETLTHINVKTSTIDQNDLKVLNDMIKIFEDQHPTSKAREKHADELFLSLFNKSIELINGRISKLNNKITDTIENMCTSQQLKLDTHKENVYLCLDIAKIKYASERKNAQKYINIWELSLRGNDDKAFCKALEDTHATNPEIEDIQAQINQKKTEIAAYKVEHEEALGRAKEIKKLSSEAKNTTGFAIVIPRLQEKLLELQNENDPLKNAAEINKIQAEIVLTEKAKTIDSALQDKEVAVHILYKDLPRLQYKQYLSELSNLVPAELVKLLPEDLSEPIYRKTGSLTPYLQGNRTTSDLNVTNSVADIVRNNLKASLDYVPTRDEQETILAKEFPKAILTFLWTHLDPQFRGIAFQKAREFGPAGEEIITDLAEKEFQSALDTTVREASTLWQSYHKSWSKSDTRVEALERLRAQLPPEKLVSAVASFINKKKDATEAENRESVKVLLTRWLGDTKRPDRQRAAREFIDSLPPNDKEAMFPEPTNVLRT